MSAQEQRKPPAQDLYEAYAFRDGIRDRSSLAARLFARRYLTPKLRGLERERLIEIGAGAGSILTVLRSTGFHDVHGIDASEHQVRAARLDGVDVEPGDALEVLARAEEGRLGAIVALDVLEHLSREHYMECLRLSARALRRGGVLLARVPNGAGLFAGTILFGDITHERAFTASALRETMMFAGFSSVSVEPVRPMVHGVRSAVRFSIWTIIEASLAVAHAAEAGDWGGPYTRNLFACARR